MLIIISMLLIMPRMMILVMVMARNILVMDRDLVMVGAVAPVRFLVLIFVSVIYVVVDFLFMDHCVFRVLYMVSVSGFGYESGYGSGLVYASGILCWLW